MGGFLEEKALAMGKKGEETEALRGLGPHSRSALGIKSDSPGYFLAAGPGWGLGRSQWWHLCFLGPVLSLFLCLLSGPWHSEKDYFNLYGK